MQFRFLVWIESHSNLACWYGRNIPQSSTGGLTTAAASHSTGATAYGLRYCGMRLSSSSSSPIADAASSSCARGVPPSTPDSRLPFNHRSKVSRSTLSGVILDNFLVRPLPEGSGIWIWEELGVGRGVPEGGVSTKVPVDTLVRSAGSKSERGITRGEC